MCGFVATQVREIEPAGSAGMYAEMCSGCKGIAWSEPGRPSRAMTESDLMRCREVDRRALAKAMAESQRSER